MANKTRAISLDRSEIKATIKTLKSMSSDIRNINTSLEKILDEAVKYCQSLTPISDGEGNHLRYDTYWEKTPNGYRIVQEGENVLYVEFGTGVVGAENPHQLASTNWVYGVGEHIFTTSDGRTGWFYPADKEKRKYKFTQGQPANMQMYKTAIWLSERLNKEVKIYMEKVKQKW